MVGKERHECHRPGLAPPPLGTALVVVVFTLMIGSFLPLRGSGSGGRGCRGTGLVALAVACVRGAAASIRVGGSGARERGRVRMKRRERIRDNRAPRCQGQIYMFLRSLPSTRSLLLRSPSARNIMEHAANLYLLTPQVSRGGE
jgi:hypothetical protein